MIANELRICNWVALYRKPEDPEQTFHQVKSIYYEDAFNDYCVVLPDGFVVNITTGIVPIPITEEVLLKCGHVLCDGRSGSGYIRVGNYDFEVNTYTSKVCTVRHPRSVHGITFPCKYLHELQNIVAITGQELTYTP